MLRRIKALPGFGEMKTTSLSAVLAKRFGVTAAEALIKPVMEGAADLSRLREACHLLTKKMLDADVTGHRPYIVTRYVPGRALDEIVKEEGPLELPADLAPGRWIELRNPVILQKL